MAIYSAYKVISVPSMFIYPLTLFPIGCLEKKTTPQIIGIEWQLLEGNWVKELFMKPGALLNSIR